MNRLAARAVLPALGLVGIMSLAACSTAEPGREDNPDHTRPVRITVSPNSTEQLILGEVYSQVLEETGRSTSLSIGDSPGEVGPLERLRAGETDLVIGCTGFFLHTLDPNRAEELSTAIETGEVEDPSDETYRAFMGALPSQMTSPDPSSAQGCAAEIRDGQAPELPQSVIPVYDRGIFDREELEEVTAVTRFLTTDEIAGLVEATGEGSSVSGAVAEWLGY
ncbi:type 2 periplasmic-binding domain-containing protein [Corynebacterium comes]|uniref:Uncharacterized protein n=1 Tax=Corynebacterium comes TaxID=2675218 RepID=A0A6B8VX31_9CORY|nr:hypothetical protein [Corynebacterium comes]QGU04287.1 hypothetical protein CETAM_05080 [Corynebacterium comes]